ncbi:uncharacterized protein LY79DRAFT_673204 [Colletotrichum navitas]|uniref:FAD-binding PCMH-type domain-containing protein n=1 Tax=Colletotrichum navitas TaxID=681940 RepID=A0AAD8PQV1_9PEZI|nr:uncharacterized protein LY79DRAFT_673204 [Colletotrichum navitas]KAK1574070.1 hypothetical protein LY79DRAFT_673204 [Colletotrichum navitas]
MTQQPLAIIRPRIEAEVSAFIQELHAQDIPFGTRSGGHDMTAAQARGRDGVMIDLRAMGSISIAEDKKSARIGGGTLSIKLSNFLQQHKLLTPHGWCPTVGTVDTDDHPDLLWALRGVGNSNFGILVEHRIKLYPKTGFLAGFLGFPAAEAGDVLIKFGKFEKELPINFIGEATHMTLPGVGPVLAWLSAWTSEDDDVDNGWRFLERMKALARHTDTQKVSVVDDYTFLNTIPSPTNTHWHPRLGTFEYLAPELANVFVSHPPPGAACATVMHTAHGRALNKKPGACHPPRTRRRIAAISVGIVDATAQAAEYEKYKNWADDMVDDLCKQRHALLYGCRNLSSDTDVDWVATYGEETAARLKEVKKKFDPANVFKNGYPRLDLLRGEIWAAAAAPITVFSIP